MKLKNLITLILFIIISTISFGATVLITEQTPVQPVDPVDAKDANKGKFTVKWTVVTDLGENIKSTVIKFKQPDNTYLEITASKFTALQEQYVYTGYNSATIPTKQYYKVEAVTDKGSFYSIESFFVFQAKTSVATLEPRYDIKTTTPKFRWNSAPGAAGYKIILSASPFSVTTDKDGNTNVDGGNVVWQVATTKTELFYGEDGDLGTTVGNPTPLMYDSSGRKDYYYIVLAMYGTSEGTIATTIPSANDITKFTLVGKPPLAATRLVEPLYQASLKNDYITFRWGSIEGANIYRLFIERKVDVQGIKTRALVYDENVKDTTLTLFAPSVLMGGDYYWYVVTEDISGNSAKSDEGLFTYTLPSRTVRGLITNSAGSSIKGVEVYLKTLSGTRVSLIPYISDSGSDTNYKIDNIIPGTYYVEAILDGYTQDNESQVVITETSPNPVTASAVRMIQNGSVINGYVYDGQTNLPLKGAIVKARDYNNKLYYTVVDNSGYYNLKIEAGIWNIEYGKDNYETRYLYDTAVKNGEIRTIDPVRLKPNDISISGKVYNDEAKLLKDATVVVYNDQKRYEYTTQEDGNFIFSLQPGTWKFYAFKVGFTASAEKTFVLYSGDNISGLSVMLNGNASVITGKVLDSYFRGVANATVVFEGAKSFTTQTDIYGKYQISVKNGDYLVKIIKQGYSQKTPVYQYVGFGESISMNIGVDTNKSSIAGTVFDSNGNILSGAMVTDGINVVYTNSLGKYLLSVNDGEYNLSVSKEGYSSAGKSITVGIGEEATGINFVLAADISIVEGNVKDGETGENLAGVKVEAGGVAVLTDNNGYYKMVLSPGKYTFKFTKENYTGTTTELLLSSGGRQQGNNVTILKNIGTVEGRVVIKGGVPVRNAEITIGNIKITANSEGYFKIGMVLENDGSAKSYPISVYKKGYSTYTGTVKIEKGTKTLSDIELQILPVVIMGKVIDSSGMAVADVKVYAGANSYFITGAEGNFVLNTNPGSVEIKTEKYGYSNGGKVIDVAGDISGLVLSIEDLRATISGQTNIPGAKISAGSFATYSDTNGYYSLKVAEGTYIINVEKTGYRIIGESISAAAKDVILKNFNLTKEEESLTITTGVTGAGIYINGPVSQYKLLGGGETKGVFILPYGDYTITVIKEGYLTYSTKLNIPDTVSIIASMQLLGGRIAGSVKESQQNILTDVKVSVYAGTDLVWSGFTDKFGGYTTTFMPQGTVKMVFEKDGYQKVEENVTVPANDISNKSTTLTPYAGKITLKFSQKIAATVILKRGTAAVANKYVESEEALFTMLPYGTYNVTIQPARDDVEATGENLGAVILSETVQSVDKTITVTEYSAKAAIKVVDGTAVISDAFAVLRDGTKIIKTKFTDVQGKVVFDRLKIGNYKVDISKDGFIGVTDSAITAAVVPVEKVITLKSNMTQITFTTITGAAVKLTIGGNIYSGIADANGTVVIEKAAAGTGYLEIGKSGYTTRNIPVKVENGKIISTGTPEVDFNQKIILNSDISLKGTITNGSYSMVIVTYEDKSGVSALADDKGNYEIKGLKGGNVIVKVKKFGFASETKTITLAEGINSADFTLRETRAAVTITVKQEGTLALVNGAKVRFAGIEIVTGENGKAEFAAIPYAEEGTKYNIEIEKGNYIIKDTIIVNSETVAKEYFAAQREGRISGTIAVNGANASVTLYNEAGVDVITVNADDKGYFDTGKVLEKGKYKLVITKVGFETVVMDVPELITNSEEKEISGLNIEMIPLFVEISGFVTSTVSDKDVLKNVKVIVDRNEVVTDGEGYFKVKVPFEAKNYIVTLKKDGYKTKVEVIEGISKTNFVVTRRIKLEDSLDKIPPTLTDLTNVAKVARGDKITFKVEAKDETKLESVKLYYSLEGGALEEAVMTLTTAAGIYSADITAEVEGKITYYIEATDGANYKQTAKTTITITGEMNYVKISPDSPQIVVGDTKELTAAAYDGAGNKLDKGLVYKWTITKGNDMIKIDGSTSSQAVNITSIGKAGEYEVKVEVTKGDRILSYTMAVRVVTIDIANGTLELQTKTVQINAGTDKLRYSVIFTPAGGQGFEVVPDNISSDSKIITIDKKDQSITTYEGKVGRPLITATYKGKKAVKMLEIFEDVSAAGKRLESNEGVILEIAQGSIASESVTVNIYKTEAPALPVGNLDIAGDVYMVSPELKALANRKSTLTMPIPKSVNLREVGTQGVDVYLWNGVEWEIIDFAKSVKGDTISVNIDKLGIYTLMVISEPLKVKEFNIYPNPFRPSNGGTLVGYKLSSSEQSVVYVNVKIFTENGKLVRVLEENEMRDKLKAYYVKWDGKDDNGGEAKNGRYIVRLEAEDISGKVAEMKSVILIK